MDIAPTILALMGVPIPTLMDGHVLSTVMSSELQNGLHTRLVEQETPVGDDSGGSVLGEEDEKIIRERLEALGYFG
jgi:arylsulfatase A-like enzyme